MTRESLRDYSQGARAYTDIDPSGPPPELLPHRYLPAYADDSREAEIRGVDDRTTCQLVAGRTRCKSTEADHRRAFPALYQAGPPEREAR